MEAAMAPSHDPHPVLIEIIIVLEHMDTAGIRVFDFEPSVIDIPVHGSSIARATSIFRCDNDITLSHQFPHNVSVVCTEITVNTPMRQYHKRILLASIDIPGDKNIGIKLERIARALSCRVGLLPPRRADNTDLVHISDIPDPLEPEDIIDGLLELVELVPQGLKLLPKVLELWAIVIQNTPRNSRISHS
jgi:hypothetical protein